jgi:predicted O-methyltransferase YrrM
MTSAEAASKVLAATAGARLIFIDGMHSYEAVSEDLRNYADLLVPGGLLVFDDYSPTFPGDVRAVLEHIDAHPGRYGRPFQQKNTLVLPRRHGA